MPNAFVQEGGTGIFSMESAIDHFARLQREARFSDRWLRRTQREGQCEWLNFRPARSRKNAIFCTGGFGDGTYFCAGGYARNGRVSHLVIDYNIIDVA
jgi:hypothetical protein